MFLNFQLALEKTWNVSDQHDIAQYTHAPAVESFGVDGLAAPATHTSSNALETEPPEPMPASFTSDNHPPPTNPTFTQPLPQYVAQASPYYVPYNTSPAQGACCVTQGQFENSLLVPCSVGPPPPALAPAREYRASTSLPCLKQRTT